MISLKTIVGVTCDDCGTFVEFFLDGEYRASNRDIRMRRLGWYQCARSDESGVFVPFKQYCPQCAQKFKGSGK